MQLSIRKDRRSLISLILNISLLLLVFYPFLSAPQPTFASANGFLRLDRDAATSPLSGVVCMKSSQTAGGVQKVIVSFPASFSLTGAANTWTVDTTPANMPQGATSGDAFTATAWPSIAGPTVVDNATKAAIFTSTDLTVSTNTYCFHFTAGTSTVGAAGDSSGSVLTYNNTSGALVENLGYGISVSTGASSDLVSVTASVSASFTFALSGGVPVNTLALPLGVLNSSTTVTTPYRVTATVGTNAGNGFLAWVKSANGGLKSNATGQTIAYAGSYNGSLTDLSGTTGAGVFAVTGTGAPTIAPEYASGDAGTSVGYVSTTNYDLMASKTGYQSGTTFTIGARAKPAASVPAGTDYTDTITVVASGSF